jgi:hypothetical protein
VWFSSSFLFFSSLFFTFLFFFPRDIHLHGDCVACVKLYVLNAVRNRSKHILYAIAWCIYTTSLSVCLSICLSLDLQPFADLVRLLSFLIFYTAGRTPWTGDQPVARPLPAHNGLQKHRINGHRHSCLKYDSNPRTQFSSGRRQFTPQTARPL